MNVLNVNQIIDGVLNASMSTYIFSFLAVSILFGLGIALSVWRAPKKDSPNEALKWPAVAPQKTASKAVEPSP